LWYGKIRPADTVARNGNGAGSGGIFGVECAAREYPLIAPVTPAGHRFSA
jgi:hypothetical protein